jgi:CDGSH-type Zn-finger protein
MKDDENKKDDIASALDKMFLEEDEKNNTEALLEPKQEHFGKKCLCGKSKRYPICDGSHAQ